jgi:hypothetical protein
VVLCNEIAGNYGPLSRQHTTAGMQEVGHQK